MTWQTLKFPWGWACKEDRGRCLQKGHPWFYHRSFSCPPMAGPESDKKHQEFEKITKRNSTKCIRLDHQLPHLIRILEETESIWEWEDPFVKWTTVSSFDDEGSLCLVVKERALSFSSQSQCSSFRYKAVVWHKKVTVFAVKQSPHCPNPKALTTWNNG